MLKFLDACFTISGFLTAANDRSAAPPSIPPSGGIKGGAGEAGTSDSRPAPVPRESASGVSSGSGESAVPVAIAGIARKHGARTVLPGSNGRSTLARTTDFFVRIPVRTKLALADEIPSRQIMSSLFEQCLLIVGDAIALRIMERKSITDLASLWSLHANLE